MMPRVTFRTGHPAHRGAQTGSRPGGSGPSPDRYQVFPGSAPGQRGMPSRARDPRCSPIASAMFRLASSSVRPCETQPGRDGTVTTYQPSSSRSNQNFELHRRVNLLVCIVSVIGLEVGEEIGGSTAPHIAALERRPRLSRLPGDLPPAGLHEPAADHLVEQGLVLERERSDLSEEGVDRHRCRTRATDG